MSTLRSTHRLFVPTLITAAVVAACGGGGGGGDAASALRQVPDAAKPSALPDGTTTTMTCVGGNTENRCSGDSVLRIEDNGVRLMSSGVFVYGQSTADGINVSDSAGLDPIFARDSAVAEIRMHRAPGTGAVDGAAMLLTDIGITWNGTAQRPRIIEAFEGKTTGVTELDAGAIVTSRALPPSTDTSYYNNNAATKTGSPENYANNRYFACPTLPAVQCDPALVDTNGVSYVEGDFRRTGTDPDRTTAHRNHSDGDVRAGTTGIPQPDSKGFRDLTLYSYLDANLAAWETKDTTFINEWTLPSVGVLEQSTRRSGIVAFGNTTVPANVPTSGEGTFRGIAYGWYTANGAANALPVRYRADVRIVVNFGSSRQADVYVENAVEDTLARPPVSAAAFVSRAAFGDIGTNVANYLVGTVDTGGSASMTSGLGARYFGQNAAEIAGSFIVKNATTGAVNVGGFIARR